MRARCYVRECFLLQQNDKKAHGAWLREHLLAGLYNSPAEWLSDPAGGES